METTKQVMIIVILTITIFSSTTKATYTIESDKSINENSFSVTVLENNNFNRYFNYAKGYSIKYPSTYKVDDSLSFVKDVFYDENTKIEVYYDDFSDTINNADTYIGYSNKDILTKDNTIEKDLEAHIEMDDYYVHLLKWKRTKYEVIEDDKNYYVSAEIVKNKDEVFTVFIKSTSPINNYMEIIEGFEFIIKKAGFPEPKKYTSQRKFEFNEKTQQFYEDYLGYSYGLKWGIFEPSAPHSMVFLNELEEKLDHEFEFLLKYQNLDSNLNVEELRNASREGKHLELTLQTNLYEGDNTNIINDILNGKYDSFFNKYARYIKEFGEPVLFRLNNEMNGDWCEYSSYYMAKDTDLYKEIWKHVYKIFEENEVDNAIWVWNPNNLDLPGFKWNHYLNYYPGDEYVDVIGLTAYNTGNYYVGEKWTSFDTLYKDLYAEYNKLFNYPFIITEFGCNSVGGDKPDWIRDMLSKLKDYNKIKVAIWFNGTDRDENGQPARIYRLDENEEVIKTFREGFKNYKEEKPLDLKFLNTN